MIRVTRREKLLAVGLVVFVAAWSLFSFAIKPALDRIETLNRLIPEKQSELQKVQMRSKEYIFLRDSFKQLQTRIASQPGSFELLPFLETLVRESGLEKKVASMKQQILPLEPAYSETVVEVKFENLTLQQLVDFLCKVESSQVLARAKSLYIKKNVTNGALLDSVVEIHNAKLTQGQIARI
jgi:type II secretory pathway component PulM